jgi:mycothiol synthase
MSKAVPTIQIRPPVMGDLEQVARLILACEQLNTDSTSYEHELGVLRADWESPTINIATDAWVAVAADGQLVGYEIVFDLASPEVAPCEGYVHPAHLGRGIGTALLRRAIERVRQANSERSEPLTKLHTSIHAADAATRALLQHEGFKVIRHHWHMRITMEEPPPPAVVPDGIVIRPFVLGQDEHVFYETNEASFADHWGHVPQPYENWAPQYASDDFDPSLWLLAWDGDQVAGAAQCRYRAHLGWVRLLGVRRPWRGRGIGMALLKHAFALFYSRGRASVGLGVDASSPTGANRLYERAGMRPVHSFESYELLLSDDPQE